MKKTTVTVPGKIFLMGEHAVVYGYPAILSAINLRLKVTVQDDKGPEALKIKSADTGGYIRHIYDLVIQKFAVSNPKPLTISVESEIPAGYHLGSSAALAAGVSGALLYHFKQIWNPVTINQTAYEAEKFIHKNPSGADNTAVTGGGLIWFRRELEFLKSIWQLPFAFPQNLNYLYLLSTGRPAETTGEMVGYVSGRYRKNPQRYENIFRENENQTRKVTLAIKNADEKSFMDAIRQGEKTLEQIGVVSPYVRKIISRISRAGGAAKILGGGGRKAGTGYLLCYIPERTYSKLDKTIRDNLKHIALGGEGIRLEKN